MNGLTDSSAVAQRWIEPDDSLEPGERILGGLTSLRLRRGRWMAYGLYFTDRRIIGVRQRMVALALILPPTVVGLTYLVLLILYGLDSRFTGAMIGVGFIVTVGEPLVRWRLRKLVDRMLVRRGLNFSDQLKKKHDLEIHRKDIAYLQLQRGTGIFGSEKSSLAIRANDSSKGVKVTVDDTSTYLTLRDHVTSFVNAERPIITLKEY